MTHNLDERLAANDENVHSDETFETNDESDWGMEELEVEETPRPVEEMDSEEKVRLMAAAADAVRASDITILDLRGLTIIADFFLICTGKSSIQIRAIADRMEEKLRDNGVRKLRIEGYQEATWILMDYGDVVAHVMAAEQREFYNLEGFWSTAPRIELDLLPEPTTLGSGQ